MFSLMIGLCVGDATLGMLIANLGYDRLTMSLPVFISDTFHAQTEVIYLKESESRSNAGIVTFNHKLINQRKENLPMPAYCVTYEGTNLMKMRSLLFVPGDRPERFDKAAQSGADAIILDLEDSVSSEHKQKARIKVAEFLMQPRNITTLVRINPIQEGLAIDDLQAILPAKPDGLVQPKTEGSGSIRALVKMMGDNAVPVLPIASETPNSIFGLGSYGEVKDDLLGLTWGAEDLPAAIGAITSRQADGSYTPPYEMVRSLLLFGAHAASVPAIETVYPAISDMSGLEAYVARGRRDGFTGMMAIHPAQIKSINDGFSPTEQELDRAKKIIDAFNKNPGVGALMVDGKMVDFPHLKQAKKLIEQNQ